MKERVTLSPSHLQHPCLLLVDLQYGDAHPDSEYVRRKTAELGDVAGAYYTARLREEVLPNAARLLAAFRRRSLDVVYVRIQSLTPDGRDRSANHKERGIHFPPGSSEGRILDEIAPAPHEIVLSKTAGSAFVGTGLRDILANLEATALIVIGVVTGSCVLATVVDATRLVDIPVVVVDDATATWSRDLQRAALDEMCAAGASLVDTDTLSALLEAANGRRAPIEMPDRGG